VCLDISREHSALCRELPNFKYRHGLVRDVLFDIFRRAWISMKKDAPVNFLTRVSPSYGIEGWRFYCGTSSPWSCFKQNGQIRESVFWQLTCFYTVQHVFIPFAFKTFDFLAPEVVNLLKNVQKVMHNNVVSPRSMNLVFQKLSFAIQKGLMEQLVVRLHFIYV
jgi:hypothetical protein